MLKLRGPGSEVLGYHHGPSPYIVSMVFASDQLQRVCLIFSSDFKTMDHYYIKFLMSENF